MEKTVQTENILGTEKVGKLLLKFSVPGIIAMLVNALYNIVDQVFIGRGVGYLGNAATNVIFPLTVFVMAFSLMIGDGAASFLSLMLGKKENEKAAQGVAIGLILPVLSAIVLTVGFQIFLVPLCKIFGATENVLPYAVEYGRIIVAGMPFCAICVSYASIIRADGNPKYNMLGLIAGCGLNLIGDPIFIFVFKWGVAGAAWATVIGQVANAIVNLLYIPRIKTVRLNRSLIKSGVSKIPTIFKLGLSSFISQIVLVVLIAFQNNILRTTGAASEYGADIPIAALGVTMKVFNILMVIVIGLATGAQPIWGYNYGARFYDRVKKTYKLVLIISTSVMIVATVIFQLWPLSVIHIFGTENAEYNQFAVKTLRIFLMLIALSGVQLSTSIFFQAVGKPVQASLISLSKQIIFMIPSMIILSNLIGVDGVLWAGAVSDLLSFTMTLILLFVSWKSIFAKRDDASIRTDNVNKASAVNSRLRYFVNGKPVVITIDRTYGAGGREIGKKLAESLNIPYYDSDIIKEAADESGLNAMFLAFVDEKNIPVNGIKPVEYTAYSGNAPIELNAIQQAAENAQYAVIEKVAQNGSCVIVGRRADQILAGKAPVFRIFITAPLSARIEKVSAAEKLSKIQAEKKIKETDQRRSSWYNVLGSGTWGVAENYDLCLNLSDMSQQDAVKVIVSLLK